MPHQAFLLCKRKRSDSGFFKLYVFFVNIASFPQYVFEKDKIPKQAVTYLPLLGFFKWMLALYEPSYSIKQALAKFDTYFSSCYTYIRLYVLKIQAKGAHK